MVGSWLGLAVVFVLVLLPRLQDGDFYEVGDPLVHLGLPVILATTASGALAGAAAGVVRRAPLGSVGRRATRAGGVVAGLTLVALYSWGVG